MHKHGDKVREAIPSVNKIFVEEMQVMRKAKIEILQLKHFLSQTVSSRGP